MDPHPLRDIIICVVGGLDHVVIKSQFIFPGSERMKRYHLIRFAVSFGTLEATLPRKFLDTVHSTPRHTEPLYWDMRL